MKKEFLFIVPVFLILFITMQNCSNNTLTSSTNENSGNNLIKTPDPTDLTQNDPLQSDQCTEIVEGRILNKPSGATQLDNSLTTPLDILRYDNIIYQTPSGWESELSTLDLFTTTNWKKESKKKPVIIYVHGGGYDGTDKSDLYIHAPKYPELFLKKGFVFVNVNYRLFQSPKSPNTTSEAQVKDIAKAVKWVLSNISQYGGNPEQIVLLGFSTASHIVALLNTDHSYFNNEGIPLNNLKAAISIDAPHYHIPLALELIKGTYLEIKLNSLKILYGNSREQQLQLSPTNYIQNNLTIKPTLLVSSGWKDQERQTVSYPATMNYKNELLRNGHYVEFYHFDEKNHTSLITDKIDDQVNIIINAFLDRIFSLNIVDQAINTIERQKIFDMINDTFLSSPNTPGSIYAFISKSSSMVVSCGTNSLFSDFQRSNINTLFSIGSVTKIFTGMVLAKLVKENKINLNNSISTMISDPNIADNISPEITFSRIVTHTSGLSSMPSNLDESRDINEDGTLDNLDPNNPAAYYGITNLVNCLTMENSDPWARCQPRPTTIGSYLYSNLGFGLLAYALQDQKKNKFSNFTQFYREYFGIPLAMDDSFAEASDINQLLINNFLSKNINNEDISSALSTLRNRFTGLHHYTNDTATSPIETPQPDMGILAGAGELKTSTQSLSKYLRLLLGYEQSSMYPIEIINEFHRELFADSTRRIAYGADIEPHEDGSVIYMKTGATKASGSYMKWSRTHQNGMFILVNRNPNSNFWESSAKLYKSLADIK